MKNKNSNAVKAGTEIPVIVVQPAPTWRPVVQLDLREIGLDTATVESNGSISRLVLAGQQVLLRAVAIPTWRHPSDKEVLDGALWIDCDPIPGISQEQASAILNALQPLYRSGQLVVREFPASEKLLALCRTRSGDK